MIKKMPYVRYIIGFFLVVIPYFTVKGGINDNDMFVERLLEISKGSFIPVIIGFVLLWPIFKYKNVNENYNKIRVILGGLILIASLFSFFSLISSVSDFIADYDISIKDFYYLNADFSARIFLLFVKICTAGLLLKPFITYSQIKKNSDSWKKEPKDLNKRLYK